MAKTFTPPFVQAAKIGAAAVTAGNTSSQGGGTIGTDIFLVISAGANDSFIDEIVLSPTATVNTNTTATVLRLFISSVSSGATTSANTWLFAEITLPPVSAGASSLAIGPLIFPVKKMLPTGFALLVTNHVAPAANSHWKVIAFGGDY